MTSIVLGAPPRSPRKGPGRVLPGFGLSLGYTLFYLSIIVLIPLLALLAKTFTMSWADFVQATTAPRVLAAYNLALGASLLPARLNLGLGLLSEVVLVG